MSEGRDHGDERDDEQAPPEPDPMASSPIEEMDSAEDAEQGLVARRRKRAKRGRVRPK